MRCRQRTACHRTLSSTPASAAAASRACRGAPPLPRASAVTPAPQRAPLTAVGADLTVATTQLPRRAASYPWRGDGCARDARAEERTRTALCGAETPSSYRGLREPDPVPTRLLSPAGEHCYRAATGRRCRAAAARRPSPRAAAGCSGQTPSGALRHGRRGAGAARPGRLVRRPLRSRWVDDSLRWQAVLWRHRIRQLPRSGGPRAERSERSERPSGARRPCAAPAHQTNASRSDALSPARRHLADVLGRRAPPLATPGVPGRPCTSRIPTSHRSYRERSPRPRRASVCRE